MFLKPEVQRTLSDSPVEEDILTWIEAFLIDRKARGCANGTLVFYQQKMKSFADFCGSQVVSKKSQITPTLVRQYLLYLEDTDHNPRGRHAAYRALRAFLLWFEDEVEPENWFNLVHKVKALRVILETLEPVKFKTVSLMQKVCESHTFFGIRDKALLLFLLDSIVRVGELKDIHMWKLNKLRGYSHSPNQYKKAPARIYAGAPNRLKVNYLTTTRRVGVLCAPNVALMATSTPAGISVGPRVIMGVEPASAPASLTSMK